jgi:hypothetical protein
MVLTVIAIGLMAFAIGRESGEERHSTLTGVAFLVGFFLLIIARL